MRNYLHLACILSLIFCCFYSVICKSEMSRSTRKYLSLNEAVEAVSSNREAESIDVVILPPDSAYQDSDEEYFDDNCINNSDNLPSDVCGPVEVHFKKSDNKESKKQPPKKKSKTNQ